MGHLRRKSLLNGDIGQFVIHIPALGPSRRHAFLLRDGEHRQDHPDFEPQGGRPGVPIENAGDDVPIDEQVDDPAGPTSFGLQILDFGEVCHGFCFIVNGFCEITGYANVNSVNLLSE